MKKFALCTLVLGGAFLAVAAPAGAQYSPVAAAIGSTIGNMAAAGAEHRCMIGTAPSRGKVDDARAGAEAAMRGYLRAAGSSASADVGTLFGRKAKHRLWTAFGAEKPVTAVDDAFARRVAAREAVVEPTALVRAGDGGSARATWIVRQTGSAQPLGYYDAALRREAGVWKLARLTLVDGNAAPAAPTQYCHAPGDVEPYVIAVAEEEAARARKKAEKAARKAAAQQAKAGS